MSAWQSWDLLWHPWWKPSSACYTITARLALFSDSPLWEWDIHNQKHWFIVTMPQWWALQIIQSKDSICIWWKCDSVRLGIKLHKICMTLAGTLDRKIWQITRANITWGPTISTSDHGIYTRRILPGTYPGLRDQALWKDVLELWRIER